MSAGGFHAKQMIAEFGDVQIHVQNPLLAPQDFDQHGKPDLQELAANIARRAQKQILRYLLTDGAGTVDASAVLIVLIGLVNRLDIKTIVLIKQLVFRCNHCVEGMSGNLLPTDPLLINGAKALAFDQIVYVLVQHEC